MQSKYLSSVSPFQGKEGPVHSAELPGEAGGHGRVPHPAHAPAPPAEGGAEEQQEWRKRRWQQDLERRRELRGVSAILLCRLCDAMNSLNLLFFVGS